MEKFQIRKNDFLSDYIKREAGALNLPHSLFFNGQRPQKCTTKMQNLKILRKLKKQKAKAKKILVTNQSKSIINQLEKLYLKFRAELNQTDEGRDLRNVIENEFNNAYDRIAMLERIGTSSKALSGLSNDLQYKLEQGITDSIREAANRYDIPFNDFRREMKID